MYYIHADEEQNPVEFFSRCWSSNSLKRSQSLSGGRRKMYSNLESGSQRQQWRAPGDNMPWFSSLLNSIRSAGVTRALHKPGNVRTGARQSSAYSVALR
jgi:hypothetical protein